MNIVIVEDQRLVRDAIKTLLNLRPEITIVAEAEHGQAALDLINESSEHIDIVLTDIEMPTMTGIELIEKLNETHPKIKSVIMTTFARSGYIKRAITAGVKGFILKEAPSDELIDAIIAIYQGKTIIAPELAISALSDNDPLTDKERKALSLAGDGLTTNEIADKLFLSQGTVRNYLSEAIFKLNATNRIDAARIAHQKGWL